MPKFFKLLAASLLAAPFALFAQQQAAVTGVVTDTSGAVVPGTAVLLTNPLTGIKYKQITDSKGAYRFPIVPPNAGYTLTFSHAGFSDGVVKDLVMQVGITRTQDERLSAGATEEVQVSGRIGEVTLNTTDASVGNNIDVELLTELPIQSRSSPAVLFSLQPGITNGAVTGARTDQSSVTLDGLDVNDIAAGQSGSGFPINGGGAPTDSVQEFRGEVAGLVSQVGTGSGGQFQLVTKNGTNRFHGLAYEYHRDAATVANSYFNNVAHVPRPNYIQNQFGGNFGGAVLKDKLFFFADFNESRIITSASTAVIVPLDNFRNGNINYIYATQGGVAGAPACAAASRQNTTPSCIGTLTPAQITALDPKKVGFDPNILSFINARYPHANDLTGGDGVNTGYYRFTTPTPNILYQGVARVDYNITAKQKLYARYTQGHQDSIQSLPFLPTDPVTHPFQDRSYGYVISHIWQIGNNKVNQFYYGDEITEFNFATTYNPTGANVYSFSGLGGPYDSPSSQRRRVPIPEVRDDFNWQLGTHNLQFGGTFKFIKTNSSLVNDFNFVGVGLGGELLTLDSSVRPSNIRGGTTAPNDYDNSFALALGRVASVGSNYNYTAAGTALPNGTGETRRYRYYQTELYLGDTWKITPHLTASYGVRYQLYTVPYEANGEESQQNTNFNDYFNARLKQSGASISGPGAVPFLTYRLAGKANNAGTLYNPSYKDFAPRVAFSYNPAYAPKTVINASAGIVYDRTVINAVNFIQDQSSFLFQNSATTQYGSLPATTLLSAAQVNLPVDPRIGSNLSYTNPNTPPQITKPFTPYVTAAGVPYGLADNQFNTVVDPNLKDPYSIAVNAGVQQEFPGHFIMRLNYSGRLGRRLLAQADASQLIEFTDPTSGQSMSAAFANLTQEARAGQKYTAQPFFENQVGRGYTVPIANAYSTLVLNGDFADVIQALQAGGYLKTNVGMASQFAENTYLTNKGFSSYHGLLLTLSKNFSQGLKFDFNYTWSHSIDNTSAPANFIAGGSGYGFVCDVTRPRECRATSDFDATTAVTADFVYQLPVGRGRMFASHVNTFVNELIGGWDVSGIPQYHSGFALNAFSDAYVAGYANNAPAILTGNREAVATHITKPGDGSVYAFRTQANAASNFVGPIGFTIGQRNQLRAPSYYNLDAGLAKRFALLPNDRLGLKFQADFFNVLNHPNFAAPNTDITSGTFGQITGTTAPAGFSTFRVGQFSLRLEF